MMTGENIEELANIDFFALGAAGSLAVSVIAAVLIVARVGFPSIVAGLAFVLGLTVAIWVFFVVVGWVVVDLAVRDG